MNIYAIYTKPDQQDTNPLIIKQGFSLIAAIFSPLWALYNRMWRVTFLVLLFCFLSTFIKLEGNYLYLVNLIIFLIFGFFASELKEYYALKNGYKLGDIILADSEEEAEVRYMMRSAVAR